jgi:hypothetical protein
MFRADCLRQTQGWLGLNTSRSFFFSENDTKVSRLGQMSDGNSTPPTAWKGACRQWLVPVGQLETDEGIIVDLWEFQHQNDSEVLTAWARHFREHYCSDTQIDALRNATGKSRAEYLRDIKFPDARAAPGPSIRSGDFAEILIADYVEFVLDYWVPRTRYADKTVRNESTKGSDILGFKLIQSGKPSKRDELAIYEVKAQLTGGTPLARLQEAIDGSARDELRKAESLNAIKQKLLDRNNLDGAAVIERFQNLADNPYSQKYGAAAIFSTPCYCEKTIATSSVANHSYKDKLSLMVISGNDLMTLAHQLYERAANEA